MIQLKDAVIMTMYLYVFVIVLSKNMLIAGIILTILGFNYLSLKKRCISHKKNLKEIMSSQRESFVNILCHDLRIPIIAQIRALEIVQCETLGYLNEEQKNMLSEIESSCRCVLNLMSLMINTYGIENNKYKLVYRNFNISDVIMSCFDELLSVAKEKNITFEYKKECMNEILTADRAEIKKVLLNVLFTSISNARNGQKICVKLKFKCKKFYLTVIGDDEKQFYNDKKFNSSFSTIGQNIRMRFCKKIIETHKGRVVDTPYRNSFKFEIPQISCQ